MEGESMSEFKSYRKKPVVIRAAQWFKNGDHPDDNVGEILADPFGGPNYERLEGTVVRFFRHPKVSGYKRCEKCSHTMHCHGWLDTLEGGNDGAQTVCPGDFIITGVQGERYPCKPGIFAETYEEA
jgi:hypothetical protein